MPDQDPIIPGFHGERIYFFCHAWLLSMRLPLGKTCTQTVHEPPERRCRGPRVRPPDTAGRGSGIAVRRKSDGLCRRTPRRKATALETAMGGGRVGLKARSCQAIFLQR